MIRPFAAALAGLLLSATVLAGEAPVYSTRKGAIRGYDPVAYFTDNRPVKGKREFSLEHDGATWSFRNVPPD